eukprot:c14696_g1_i1 orf=216-938(+)
MDWIRSRLGSSYRETGSAYPDMASSSSEVSARENTEDDLMIAQVLSEELSSGGDAAIGKRLSHLSSIPHIPRINRSIPTYTDAESDHQRLLERLYEYGLEERKMSGDGNCQFRAISDQLYRTPEKHKYVRKHVIYQLKARKDLYQEYVPMKYKDYIRKMAKQGEWGDHVTLQAAADCFGMKICLVTSFKDTRYIEIMPKTPQRKDDIFLSFWSEVHYNSLYQLPDATAEMPKPKKKHWLF